MASTFSINNEIEFNWQSLISQKNGQDKL